jgi:hypothetical protein
MPLPCQDVVVHFLSHAEKECHDHKKFCCHFQLPYANFLEFCKDLEESGEFQRWLSKDAVGNLSFPLSLMILHFLQYLGCGWTFDDLEEVTLINEETHRQFFH